MQNLIKIQFITDHQDYRKGQIVELEEKQAINFLTNGKALKIHRKKDEVVEENSEEKTTDKGNKKSKKNDQ